mmetsp:Transcript_45809/g.95942  ORF Transcript_45809/g.95942 Transcript_45809/m.95942 type:complete len:202 (-) Transcript_45809:227-832(-)
MTEQAYVLDSFDPEEDELLDELSNQNILRIVKGDIPDNEVNLLLWKCLGYKQIDGVWTSDDVFPKWRAKYPSPPDVIGVLRNYTYSIDRPVQQANQQLVASIPLKYKQGVKEHLRPLGFTGFMLDELTPNKTRRAQVANWLLFYREALRGKTLEQLRAEQEADKASAPAPAVVGPDSLQRRDAGSKMEPQSHWKYPNKPLA